MIKGTVELKIKTIVNKEYVIHVSPNWSANRVNLIVNQKFAKPGKKTRFIINGRVVHGTNRIETYLGQDNRCFVMLKDLSGKEKVEQAPIAYRTRSRKRKREQDEELAKQSCQIFVKNVASGQTLVINTPLNENLFWIKQKIYDRIALPPSEQRLIWSGRQLDDGEVLWDAGIRKESVMHLCYRLRGC